MEFLLTIFVSIACVVVKHKDNPFLIGQSNSPVSNRPFAAFIDISDSEVQYCKNR